MTDFSMDLLALQAVNQILHRGVRFRRLVLSAAEGAFFVVLTRLLVQQWMLWESIVHVFGNPLMLLVAFGKRSLRQFIQQWICMYVMQLFQGGLVYICLEHTAFGNQIGWSWLVAALAMGMLPCLFQAYCRREAQVFEVQLRQNKTVLVLYGFYDTGNHLRDPYNGKPVQIVERGVLQRLLKEEKLLVRQIPFKAVGTECGLLEAVTLEQMTICVRGKTQNVSPVVVAMAEDGTFQGQNYQVLLNAESLQGQ